MTTRKADYVARRTSTPKAVDGDVRSGRWSNVEWSPRFVDMVDGRPGMYDTRVAAVWDDENLHVAFVAEEPFVTAHQKLLPWTGLTLLANGRSLPPRPGDEWTMFLGRFQKLTVSGVEIQPHPATALTSHGEYDTHRPECGSVIRFEE